MCYYLICTNHIRIEDFDSVRVPCEEIVNKIARGPHLGNPKHHIKSVLFLGFWIKSVSLHQWCFSLFL